MSKKKFKAGLESLFGEPAVAGMSPFLVEEKSPEKKKEVTNPKRKKRSSSKNFTSNLESLFSNALDKETEYVERNDARSSLIGKQKATKKYTDKPIIGLDALIRKTTENNYDKPASNPLRKRLTITMEQQKLDELKRVAKEKKTYLKDIINDLVSGYLEKNPS